MASKRQSMDDRSGPGMKKANMAAPFKFIAFQKSGFGGEGAAPGPAAGSSTTPSQPRFLTSYVGDFYFGGQLSAVHFYTLPPPPSRDKLKLIK